jgi:hypothetical protein
MVVVLAAFDSFDTVSRSQAYQADRSLTLDDMRGVLNRMTRELRQATSVTGQSDVTSGTLTYTTYINDVSTSVTYTATGTYDPSTHLCTSLTTCTLTRQVGTGTAFSVLTRLTNSNIFTPRSAFAVTGIQWVEIDLTVNPIKSPDTTLELQSKVNLRNRTATLTGTTS